MPSANDDNETNAGVAKEEADDTSGTGDSKNKVEKTLDYSLERGNDSARATPSSKYGSTASTSSRVDSEDGRNASQSSRRNLDYSDDHSEGYSRHGRDSWSTSRSSLLVIDDYYTQEELQDGDTSQQARISRSQGRQSQGQGEIRRSRSRSRRPILMRSRSLSIGRGQVTGLVPRVTPRLRVSRSRIDSVLPVAVPGLHRTESVESDGEEEKEEWQYVPFSFWALPRRDKLILFSLGTTDLTLYMCLSILAPFFPNEATARGVSGTVAGWVFGCFALTQFIFSPIFGYFLPKLGSRYMILAGQFMAGGCTILFGLLDYIPYDDGGTLFVVFCFLVRTLLAVACTASATASFSIMVNTFPDNVATVFGLLETSSGVGLMIGPALGGVLYEVRGFMLPFVFLGVLMLIAVPINMCILPYQNDESGAPLKSGSLCQVLCIPSVMVVSVATVIGALIWAILDPTLEPHFDVYKLNPSTIGLIFLLMSAFYAISSPFWGWIADKVEDSTPMLVLGFLFSAVGLLLLGPSTLLGFPPGYRQLWLDLVALIILGMSVSLAVVPTFEKILDAAEKAGVEDSLAMYSNVAGLWGGAYALGDFIGPSAGGFLVDTFGFDWCMTFTAAPCVLIAIALLILWIYEKKVGPTPCLISVRPPPKLKPVPSERTPLLTGSSTECHTLPGSSTNGSIHGNDVMRSLDNPPDHMEDYEPITRSV